MSITAVLSGLTLTQGDHVKSQQAFTDNYGSYGWFGQLTAFTNDESYAVKLAQAGTLTVSGTPVSLPKTITLASGWTWIPMPYQTTASLAHGLPTLGYALGDQAKSQFAFSDNYGSYGWFGQLTQLTPGVGYRVKVASGGLATFS